MKLHRAIFNLSVLPLGVAILAACQISDVTELQHTKNQQTVSQIHNAHVVKASDKKQTHPNDKRVKLAGEHKKTHKPHWEYAGTHGPNHWSELSTTFQTCAAGRLQSPFNIRADIKADLPKLDLDYHSVPMKVINNGHTIQVDQKGSGQLNVDGRTYSLLQFHFHASSEYTINGERYPLEVHLVHASESGDLAVVGVMFKEGAENTELAKIWANMPSRKGMNTVAGQNVNVKKLLPKNKAYYRFMGSLTTPPCSEGVNWHMMKTPITASTAQIARFKELYPHNARPLQAENNRLVVLGK